MIDIINIHGIITVLNTPFTEQNEIDRDGLQRHVRYALEAGVAGFLVPALASEVYKLSAAERRILVEDVVCAVGGRVPVIGSATANTASERVTAAAHCIEAGCDGVLAAIPFTEEAQYLHDVRELAELAPGFLMLQDWDPNGYGLPLPLILRLREEVPAFRAIKIETAGAGYKYSQVLAATQGGLHVSGGWAVTQMIEGLSRGIHAFMPTGLHHTYCRIYRRWQENRQEEARALFEQLLPILAFSNQHLDISIHFFKRLLHTQGIYSTARVREPILPFDAFHEEAACPLIERACRLEGGHA
jgi:4-hydroxy-tetrahydrodipicolinate synthase